MCELHPPGGLNPIKSFNDAFDYHFDPEAQYDSKTLQLMAEYARNRSRPTLAAALLRLLEQVNAE